MPTKKPTSRPKPRKPWKIDPTDIDPDIAAMIERAVNRVLALDFAGTQAAFVRRCNELSAWVTNAAEGEELHGAIPLVLELIGMARRLGFAERPISLRYMHVDNVTVLYVDYVGPFGGAVRAERLMVMIASDGRPTIKFRGLERERLIENLRRWTVAAQSQLPHEFIDREPDEADVMAYIQGLYLEQLRVLNPAELVKAEPKTVPPTLGGNVRADQAEDVRSFTYQQIRAGVGIGETTLRNVVRDADIDRPTVGQHGHQFTLKEIQRMADLHVKKNANMKDNWRQYIESCEKLLASPSQQPASKPHRNLVLSAAERAVRDLILEQRPGEGIMKKEILKELDRRRQGIDESHFDKRIVPRLKKDFGLQNRRTVGYFFPASSPPS